MPDQPGEHASRWRALQHEVLDYLVAHRDAKDTVEGIIQWWLVGAHARVRASDMVAALEDLVTRGWMTTTTVSQGAPLYGLDKTRLPEIQAFLRTDGLPAPSEGLLGS